MLFHRRIVLSALGLLLVLPHTGSSADLHWGKAWNLRNGRLKVSADSHRLVHENGTPFLWIGDTAWELFHRLDRDEADQYLEDRRSKGFTVIQSVLLAALDGLNVPNAYGHRPLNNNDPSRPAVLSGRRNDYWDHVDYIIDRAEREGLVMALVPTWGEWVTPRFVEEPVFKTAEDAYRYGNFLGKRYRRQDHLVWVLGGGRAPTEWPHAREVWRAMAEGIADGVNNESRLDHRADFSTTLMTYHSTASASEWWSDAPWIDFYMWGTDHTADDWKRSFNLGMMDWQRANPKPTLNAEPCYEAMPRKDAGDDRFVTDEDVRNAAYWSMLSGSFGFTYGAYPVWQMWKGYTPPAFVPVPPSAPPRMTWEEALDLPGATQMYYLRRLMLTRPFDQLRPDQSLLEEPPTQEGLEIADAIRAARGDRFALVYSPHGKSIRLQVDRFTREPFKAYWFDPRNGRFVAIGTYDPMPRLMFDPPGEGPGNDWVLLLEEVSARFDPPEDD